MCTKKLTSGHLILPNVSWKQKLKMKLLKINKTVGSGYKLSKWFIQGGSPDSKKRQSTGKLWNKWKFCSLIIICSQIKIYREREKEVPRLSNWKDLEPHFLCCCVSSHLCCLKVLYMHNVCVHLESLHPTKSCSCMPLLPTITWTLNKGEANNNLTEHEECIRRDIVGR